MKKKKETTVRQKRVTKDAEEDNFEKEYRTLITTWIELHENSPENNDELFWAFEKLDDICRDDPPLTLKIIRAILASTQDERVLANLATGPLENLLSRHGEKVIVDIETLARKEPQFRSLLQRVWQLGMSEDIWNRVLKASGRA